MNAAIYFKYQRRPSTSRLLTVRFRWTPCMFIFNAFILNFVNIIGLFPLLSNAAMNVRSILLTVYENHFVPLGDRLRPGLNGFLSGRIK